MQEMLSSPSIRRRLGDMNTWKVALNMEGVEASHVPESVLDLSCIKIRSIYDPPPLNWLYHIRCKLITSLVLKHEYLSFHVGHHEILTFLGWQYEKETQGVG